MRLKTKYFIQRLNLSLHLLVKFPHRRTIGKAMSLPTLTTVMPGPNRAFFSENGEILMYKHTNNLYFLKRGERLNNVAWTGVSLHCHTLHSKELLDFVPYYAERISIVSSIHSPLKRNSVFSGSSSLNICRLYVSALASISSRVSGGRVTFFPEGSPIVPVKSPIKK